VGAFKFGLKVFLPMAAGAGRVVGAIVERCEGRRAMTEGYVTTHVLDAGRGCPAAGMRIELWRIEGEGRTLLRSVITNTDGRTDGAVIAKGELEAGVFELLFHAGAYLDAVGAPGERPRFLDVIPIRFGIADPGEHYHVPLLLAPYSYSTYRGS
jgi:5-hydroxyisourate hydrolase